MIQRNLSKQNINTILFICIMELHTVFSAGTAWNVTTCLNCSNVVRPQDCQATSRCNQGQVCYTETVLENGKTMYRMGCVDQTSCSNVTSGNTTVGRRWLLHQGYDPAAYCSKCCTGATDNCNGELCTGAPASKGIIEMMLVNPPTRTSVCTDVSPATCRLLAQRNTSFCLEPHVRQVACRQFCGTCSVTTSAALPTHDCFYESTLYGGRASTTINNKTCRDWTEFMTSNVTFPSNTTHVHASVKDAGNSCRDPDGKGHPWCFVAQTHDSQSWEYCDVSYCQECYYAGKSSQYNGYKSDITGTGSCQMWSDVDGRVLSLTDAHFPEGAIAKARNYCRDPLSIGYVYCFSNDALVKCNVPQCTGECEDDPDTDCDILSSTVGVCNDDYFSTIMCPKTCGKCGFGLLPPTHREPPTDACADNPFANCAAQHVAICADAVAARKFCPKACNECDSLLTSTPLPHVSVTTPQSTTTTHGSIYTSPWKPAYTSISSNTDTCNDEGRLDCTAPELTSVICDDPELVIYCNRTCKRCPDECQDSPNVNCAAPSIRTVVCPVDAYARGFCRKTCGKCDLPSLNVTRNSCTDPKGNTDMCPFFNQEICICDDPELRPLICPYYCAGHCGPVVFGAECGHKATTPR